jgi:hypothetical protein
MERHVICDGNHKAVELAIMIEAGTMVKNQLLMKWDEEDWMFLSKYVKIMHLIPNDNVKGSNGCQEML